MSAFEHTASAIVPRSPGNGKASNLFALSQYAKSALPLLAPGIQTLSAEDATRFLHLVTSCAKITTHYELFLLVQGELQFFLPQDVLIAAWGDFGAKDPQIDVISNLPGMRTDGLCDNIVPMAKRLYNIWIGGGSQAMAQNGKVTAWNPCINASCAKPCCLFPDMQLTLVHGIHNKRDGYDSLYIALRRDPVANDGEVAPRHFLADAVIHQLDAAHRKVAALGVTAARCDERLGSMQLSAREEEVTHWLCQGKTNTQIAQILGISVNTVKNHIHRIFDKLGANNRTQAVAKYRSRGGSAESKIAYGNFL